MIIVGATPAPPPTQPELRILRIITVDETGDERWWNFDDLQREHPELFSQRSVSRAGTITPTPQVIGDVAEEPVPPELPGR